MRLRTLALTGLALACLAIAASASAQTTWHQLQFGESRADARTQLVAQKIDVSTSSEGTLQSAVDYELALPGLLYTVPMQLNVHFDDQATLADVTLALDLRSMRRYWGTLGPDEALFNFAAEKLMGALSGRYGPPIYNSANCDASLKPGDYCIVSWRGNDQTVELERASTAKGLRLLVRYQPLATDL